MQIFGVTGESLGAIGTEEDQHSKQREPGWREMLAGKPSVSVRKGIAWGTNPPTEPTSTLVLTSSQSHFVDIRFSLTGPTPTSPPHYWAFAGISQSTFPPSTIPTTSTTTTTTICSPLPTTDPDPDPDPDPPPVSFPCSIYTTWTRYLDSRGDITTPDSGMSFLLHNGDCLEVGEMQNPETGTVQAYQELWTSPSDGEAEGYSIAETEATAAAAGAEGAPTPSHSVTTNTNTPSHSTVRNTVLKSDIDLKPKQVVTVALFHRPSSPSSSASSTPSSRPSGMIIRVGDYCQGIVELPQDTTTTTTIPTTLPNQEPQPRSRMPKDGFVRVERWIFHRHHPPPNEGEPTTAQGTWRRDPRSTYIEDEDPEHEPMTSRIWMPCPWLCGDQQQQQHQQQRKLGVGDSISREGFEGVWRVVEAEGPWVSQLVS